MRHGSLPHAMLGYCTNVHAGPTFDQTKANLETHAMAVKAQVSPDAPMGVGLWLAQPAARQIIEDQQIDAFADWLQQRGLVPFTFNGFPFGDFHQEVVKHRVYHPNWADPARLQYTVDLARIQSQLLGDATEGGISTLPIGWRTDILETAGAIDLAATHLLMLVEQLWRLELDTGKRIHVDIEPEPGCYLDTSKDVVALFKDHLFPRGDEAMIRRYLRVCHDVCHAAVMFEDQKAMFARYRDAGIQIGKVQVSSAVQAPLEAMDDAQRRLAIEQLRAFHEPRYLHQTVVADGAGSQFFDDLPEALESLGEAAAAAAPWRVHFHVPLFLQSFGLLQSTQAQVLTCLSELVQDPTISHYEAETYAWSVLPTELQSSSLADGIARELSWLDQAMTHAASGGAG